MKFAVLSLLFIAAPLRGADIYLQIQRGEKVAVAIPEFSTKDDTPETGALSREIHDTAKDDILFTRFFNLAEAGPALTEGKIDFGAWGTAGADLLIKGVVSQSDGNVTFTASVFEVPDGNPIFQKLYRTPLRNARQAAHEFVADFIFRFTGSRGVSNSRIAFANDTTGNKEIYVIDYDGKNLRRLTHDKSVAILPRWAPDKKEILYTTYRHGNPDLALFSLAAGKPAIFSRRKGLNTSGSFSPDGSQVVATLSFQGATSLYLLDRAGKIIRRLTHSKSADTSASFSADGRKIIFASDRSGGPQIYMMDADGSGLERLTDGGWCDAPAWSPSGDKIAYSRGDGSGLHDIIVQDLSSGKKIRITSDSGKNENPVFSPDGRFIAFSSTRKGKKQIYIASLDGIVQRKLSDIPGSSSTPAWEP
ncbi:MAG: hypothetical protein A2901_02880 [Elusimicrobia bacterium RIFCSPLOWO2_01_FULL_54_10]|nr:MAG: hypothetical protein A2901_02880 [Elusimicrobia bacterium RIFCSPLOWO2_01_FULL_54_10]